MKKIKPLIVLATLLIALTLVVPAVLVLPFSDEHKASGKLGEELKKTSNNEAQASSTADMAVEVAVFRSAKSKIEKVNLEDYLVGVVAAEMPADFKEEALKAQALTARTYIVKRLVSKDTLGAPKGAQVTDTVIHQVYKSDEELRRAWGTDYDWKMKKVLEAVRSTAGQILTYKGEAIQATFFSTSNGYTENSEDYWGGNIPYLKSVSSPWDKKSPKFNSQKVMTVKEFEAKLGVKVGAGSQIGKIVERTTGKRVAKVDFSGKVLSGKDIREKLDLRSSDFAWERKGANIVITTKGFGHGVGMSQYGANGMAEEGKNYKDIVKHYYQGVEITSADSLMATITAQK
ncbi:stage II sporulation protein D [Bacillus sp. SORGH_AS 510]|uniref:stage II sporulation protein D n=1 Tax=Bacillus sp. SORGH_AS_0510 TaxID=3041771 RepID=UPI002785DC8E|nr:stage II sporulation protein D [Bacillus sp. SORGH_AS_0510]MDQ1143616.1 stage II sporulation protein D [Bacillus sp. SORGH_AS_0510]